MRNQYPATCTNCNKLVRAGEGHYSQAGVRHIEPCAARDADAEEVYRFEGAEDGLETQIYRLRRGARSRMQVTTRAFGDQGWRDINPSWAVVPLMDEIEAMSRRSVHSSTRRVMVAGSKCSVICLHENGTWEQPVFQLQDDMTEDELVAAVQAYQGPGFFSFLDACVDQDAPDDCTIPLSKNKDPHGGTTNTGA